MITKQEQLDIMRQIGNRLCVAAYILQNTKEEDEAILNCLPTLIEDNHLDSQSLIDALCISEETPSTT